MGSREVKHTPKNTPIIIPCFERPEYFQQCLDALSQCKDIEKFTVHFCRDTRKDHIPKHLDPKPSTIKNMCESWNRSPKVIHDREVKYPSQNAIGSVGYVMNKCGYDKGFIYIEEDIVVAKCYLNFCLSGLNYYQNNPYVSAIGGYNVSSEKGFITKDRSVKMHLWLRNLLKAIEKFQMKLPEPEGPKAVKIKKVKVEEKEVEKSPRGEIDVDAVENELLAVQEKLRAMGAS